MVEGAGPPGPGSAMHGLARVAGHDALEVARRKVEKAGDEGVDRAFLAALDRLVREAHEPRLQRLQPAPAA